MGDLSKYFSASSSSQKSTPKKRLQPSKPVKPAKPPEKKQKIEVSLIEDPKISQESSKSAFDSLDLAMQDSDDDMPKEISPPKISLIKPPPDFLSKRKTVISKPSYKIPENLRDIKKHGESQAKTQKVTGTKVQKKNQDIKPGPLTGQTIVITGIISTIERDELTELLRSYGSRVTGSVSRKTTCLIHGQKLEDGRHYTEGRKYKTAKEFGIKIIDEKELQEMLSFLLGANEAALQLQSPQPTNENKQPNLTIPDAIPPPMIPVGNQLWTDKYKPSTLKEIVGNTQAIEKLVNWLKDWPDVILRENKKDIRPVKGGRFDPQLNVNARAALISGPPGVGKTTAARLVAKGLMYQVMETNASDFRSRKAILDPLKSTSDSNSLTRKGNIVKSCLIMDEVDGMCAGDRGGAWALLEVIKVTKIPIICICNERQSRKLKSIGNISYDIRFQKPNKSQIVKRIQAILNKEGMNVDSSALEQVVESCGNDIRQVITVMEMWSRNSPTMNTMQAKKGLKSITKDPISMIGNFDAGAKLLNWRETKTLRHREKMDLFFVDFDLIPLLIHENYLSAIAMDSTAIYRMAEAADSIAFSDLISRQMRNGNEWSLLQHYGQAAAIEPGALTGNGVPFPRFPEWFGKFSTTRKNERMLRNIRSTMAGHISGDNESVLNDYIPIIYHLIMEPLKKLEIDGVDEAVSQMFLYNLNPDMFKEHLIQLQFGTPTYEEEYKNLSTKLKSQLTKSYNLMHKSSIAKKKKKKTGDRAEKDKFDPEFEDPDQSEKSAEESEESEEEVKGKIIKKKK
ncbi:unnamed protein product [Blepharisma stoltei]|uniref:Replication factor C subunit 1 n=1 Tax=Blepharisma stoltei TaxID=1481888 RepID=A0AAU9JKB3_9CILI|nr:unnamed protein product [Blepharisma stoltei]